MAIGVPYELFWELCPNSLSPFVKAFSITQANRDADLWRLGVYIQQAVASVLSKDAKYPKKPFGYEDNTMTDEQKEQEMRDRFLRHIELINRKF